MIIEDSKDLQEIYKLSFESIGCEVVQAMDGLEGISTVLDIKPDVILLDITMPGMDGFTFLKLLKGNTDINVPVIVCTNLSDEETNKKALAAGAVAVLLKSDYTGKQLVERVCSILENCK